MKLDLPRQPLAPARIDAFVLRTPIATPVRTSFGVMTDRPAVFVRVRDADGAEGWGEAWCNFPSCGAEHRARLVETVLAPMLTSRSFDGPADAFEFLSRGTDVLAIQSGEYGPIAQAIAGLDLALWDLCARRAGEPLWRYLGGHSDEVPVYASGINPEAPEQVVARGLVEGFRAFKLKVGFGRDVDLANVARLRDLLGPDIPLMLDANQGWALQESLAMAQLLEPFDIHWLEEPLRADRPWTEWQQLAQASAIPLAAGENLAAGDFARALESKALRVLQPDAAKWGGISGCWPVIHSAMQAGLRYCPHYLGGGIGLLASAHMLAACGGDGLLEVDANPNPLRTEVARQLTHIAEGRCALGTAPGIGIAPDMAELARNSAA